MIFFIKKYPTFFASNTFKSPGDRNGFENRKQKRQCRRHILTLSEQHWPLCSYMCQFLKFTFHSHLIFVWIHTGLKFIFTGNLLKNDPEGNKQSPWASDTQKSTERGSFRVLRGNFLPTGFCAAKDGLNSPAENKSGSTYEEGERERDSVCVWERERESVCLWEKG